MISVKAQDRNEPLKIERLTGQITLDGIINESSWQQIKPLPLLTHWPEFGKKSSERTELRVTYDNNYIYFPGICDAAEENILAASFKRDLNTLGTDYLTILLDTFSDNENTLLFATTPTRNRMDMALSEDTGRSLQNIDLPA